MKTSIMLLACILTAPTLLADTVAESTNRIAPAALSFERGLFSTPTSVALPDWIRAAGYEQGDVGGTPSSWHGEATLSEGAGRVWIELNRAAMNEDLALTLLYERNAASDMAIQLCDAEGRVLALDLFKNALAIAEQARTETFIIPVRKFPSANRIVLRRISGDLRLYGAVLAPVITEQPEELDVLLDLLKRLGDRLSPESDLVRRMTEIAAARAAETNAVESTRGVPLARAGGSARPDDGTAGATDGGVWRHAGNYPVACGMMAATLFDGRVYALGGYNYNWLSDVRTFDPRKPEQGWTSVASMPAGRACHGAVTVGGKIYAIGGLCDQMAQSSVFTFDPQQPGKGWSTISSLPVPLQRLSAVAVDNRIFVLGGGSPTGVETSVYVLDTREPGSGWQRGNSLPAPRCMLGVTVSGGKIFAIGGSDDHEVQASVFVLDVGRPSATWQSIEALPEPRTTVAAVSANGKVYAIGGAGPDGVARRTVYVYDPTHPTKGWARGGELPSIKCEAPAVVADGRVFMLSGATRCLTYEASIFEGSLNPQHMGR